MKVIWIQASHATRKHTEVEIPCQIYAHPKWVVIWFSFALTACVVWFEIDAHHIASEHQFVTIKSSNVANFASRSCRFTYDWFLLLLLKLAVGFIALLSIRFQTLQRKRNDDSYISELNFLMKFGNSIENLNVDSSEYWRFLTHETHWRYQA